MRIIQNLAAVLLLGSMLTGPASAASYTITLDNMKFGQVPAELHVGDTIIWRNGDMFRHTATARDDSFDVDLPPGGEGRTVIGKPGRIDFFCRLHPGMTGRLNVQP